jgi:hypothetical protein
VTADPPKTPPSPSLRLLLVRIVSIILSVLFYRRRSYQCFNGAKVRRCIGEPPPRRHGLAMVGGRISLVLFQIEFRILIAVLSCANNCASVYESIVWCVATGGDCTFLFFDWIQCSYSYCADTYLYLYGQCVEKQREMNECSSCPFLATASGELLTLPPTCSVFEEDYCTWQACCEPCQYYQNFHGESMQMNFNNWDVLRAYHGGPFSRDTPCVGKVRTT